MGCECDRGGRYFISIFYYGSMEPLLISGQGFSSFFEHIFGLFDDFSKF